MYIEIISFIVAVMVTLTSTFIQSPIYNDDVNNFLGAFVQFNVLP